MVGWGGVALSGEPCFEPVYWSRRFALLQFGFSLLGLLVGVSINDPAYLINKVIILVVGAGLLSSCVPVLVRRAPALEVADGELLYRRLTVRRRPLADLVSVVALSGRDTMTGGGRVRLDFRNARGYSVPFRWLACDREETLARLRALRRDHGVGSSIESFEE
jgi:hypothetical protein